MTDAILDRMGTVDKYMGDAIMAFWNAPLDDPDHAAHAVESALKMRETLVTLNESWRNRAETDGRPFKPVRFGIGLNSGECCVGNLGSLRRFDYSAIGDEVNVASRLEGACKIFEVDIIGSETVRSEAPDFAWLEIDSVLVKGKTRPVGLYALAGDPPSPRATNSGTSPACMPRCCRPTGTETSPAPSLWRRKPRLARQLRFVASTRITCAVSANWRRAFRTPIGGLSSLWTRNSLDPKTIGRMHGRNATNCPCPEQRRRKGL